MFTMMIWKLSFCFANLWKLQRLREIFLNLCQDFFEEHGIEWKNVRAVCRDGATAMFGCRSGFQALIKTTTPNAIGTYCVIHRQVLAAKTSPSGLKQIM
jgi:hypothetical protein